MNIMTTDMMGEMNIVIYMFEPMKQTSLACRLCVVRIIVGLFHFLVRKMSLQLNIYGGSIALWTEEALLGTWVNCIEGVS